LYVTILGLAPQAVESIKDLVDSCTWEKIDSLPVREPQPEPDNDPIIPGLPDGERPTHTVRLQAQGGGLQKSVTLTGINPITVAQGLAGLEALKSKIGKDEYNLRATAFARAERYIRSGPPIGLWPPGDSFEVYKAKSGIRVDVEIVRGVNFKQ